VLRWAIEPSNEKTNMQWASSDNSGRSTSRTKTTSEEPASHGVMRTSRHNIVAQFLEKYK